MIRIKKDKFSIKMLEPFFVGLIVGLNLFREGGTFK